MSKKIHDCCPKAHCVNFNIHKEGNCKLTDAEFDLCVSNDFNLFVEDDPSEGYSTLEDGIEFHQSISGLEE